ncbi:hypothetical protein ACFYVL_09965 [Streptomyces sp. NPDC004111]|uniref:hypothetical protein n=1 Tax=Streptomyces sp. NPDC004111 TaxID=3364690 RepID=UPI0036A3EE59
MALRDHPLFRKFISLHLPAGDYVIAGSAPMLAHGMNRTIGDIDIVARGKAWKAALELGPAKRSPLGPAQRIVLFGGEIEILDGWFGYSVDALIEEGEEIEGLSFLPLARTAEWKSALRRDVDLADIESIREFLSAAP